MSNTPDLASHTAANNDVVTVSSLSCITSDVGGSELLPLSPFTALRYHFGMLMGVADFETEQGYHRAKMRIHNAWLHRAGVIWGFGVSVDADHGEIRVTPGLALDAAGHELHLEADACINVNAWIDDKKEKDANFDLKKEGFDVHVAIRFKPCLTRQVPALLEPCENASTGTAYSRVFETIEILLLPHSAPVPVYPYHRLRILFGLEAPLTITRAELDQLEAKEAANTLSNEERKKLQQVRQDREVVLAVEEIRALPAHDQRARWLHAFHRFAALDEIDLQPAKSADGARTLLFPGQDNEPVFLANISGLSLTESNGQWQLSGGTVDTSVRPSHVATTTIQDLLTGRLGEAEPPAADNGPRIYPDSVVLLTSTEIQFRINKIPHEASLKAAAFSVTSFDPSSGWTKSDVVNAAHGGAGTETVNLQLHQPVRGRVRLIVFGTGPTPLLGADLFPLAGAVGGPRGTMHDGNDFVHMQDFVAPEPEPEPGPEPEPEPESGETEREEVDGETTAERSTAEVSRGRGRIRRSRSAK